MMNKTRCTTEARHCTKCGSYAIVNTTTDRGYRRTSACCGADIAVNFETCTGGHKNLDTGSPARKGSSEPRKAATPSKPSKARTSGSHAACDHPSTPAARRACRAARKA